MEKLNMAKMNIANMNALIKKGYLLAGVVMAANMFAVNEMRASEINEDNIEKEKEEKNPITDKTKSGPSILGRLLSLENTINLVGGAVFTLANSYYKFYENKPGFYFDYYFTGWNSNPFAKGYLQFCPNINLGRGIFWLIPGAYFYKKSQESEDYLRFLHVSALIASIFMKRKLIIVFFLLQGFVSMPLTLHLSNFSISISLDSILWGIIGKILELNGKKNVDKVGKIDKISNPKLNDIYNNFYEEEEGTNLNDNKNNESNNTIEINETKLID